MYKILVPTDFSEFSDYALEYGAFLANKGDGKLYVMHIVRKKSRYEEEEAKLNDVLQSDWVKDVDVEIILESGNNVSKTINKVAQRLDVDLIIMGSNGVSNVEEMILGSNTENVIVKTKFDVLTVKHKMNSEELDRIVFPSNFTPESYSVFDSVIMTAKAFNACIHLLMIGEDNESNRERIKSFIDYFELKKREVKYLISIIQSSSLELGILNYAIDNDIDLIAIGTHGKGAIKKFLNESISQSVVRDAFRPVLTMRF